MFDIYRADMYLFVGLSIVWKYKSCILVWFCPAAKQFRYIVCTSDMLRDVLYPIY
jgi:hypothetical protein